MRYAENWTQVDIEDFDFDSVLTWCAENLNGQQFIDKKMIKFEDEAEATKFQSEYKE